MFNALTGGCRTWHPSTYRMSRPAGLDHFVLLIIRTYGEFQIGAHSFKAFPNHALIIAPNTSYSYGNPKGDYIDDWLHFQVDDPACEDTLKEMAGAPFPIDDLEFYTFCIQYVLLENVNNHSTRTRENTEAFFTLIFNHLIDAYHSRNSPVAAKSLQNQLMLLRLQMENTAELEHHIQQYAQRLQISESYFQYLYKRLFGISFGQDLIRMRIERAKRFIQTTNLSLNEIAEMCGYTNEVHFYRQFKKMTGTTPAKFRKVKQET